ncbi:MAG: hypothetical protein ACRC6V_03300 [Bacteroidales bacterium]
MNIVEEHPCLQTFLMQTMLVARLSKVTRKKIGAMIVAQVTDTRWEVLSQACNGVASGEPHVFELNGSTLSNVIHAEENAINKVDWNNIRYKRIALLVTASPCSGCATKILRYPKITDVVYIDAYRDQDSVLYLKEKIQVHTLTPDCRQKMYFGLEDTKALLPLADDAWRICHALIRGADCVTTESLLYSRSHLQSVIYAVITACAGWPEIKVNNIVISDEKLPEVLGSSSCHFHVNRYTIGETSKGSVQVIVRTTENKPTYYIESRCAS